MRKTIVTVAAIAAIPLAGATTAAATATTNTPAVHRTPAPGQVWQTSDGRFFTTTDAKCNLLVVWQYDDMTMSWRLFRQTYPDARLIWPHGQQGK